MSNIGPQTLTATLFDRRRDLCIALAHRFAGVKPTDPANAWLNRLFGHLSPIDQMRCRAELLDCRTARRAHILRGVA